MVRAGRAFCNGARNKNRERQQQNSKGAHGEQSLPAATADRNRNSCFCVGTLRAAFGRFQHLAVKLLQPIIFGKRLIEAEAADGRDIDGAIQPVTCLAELEIEISTALRQLRGMPTFGKFSVDGLEREAHYIIGRRVKCSCAMAVEAEIPQEPNQYNRWPSALITWSAAFDTQPSAFSGLPPYVSAPQH